MTASPDRPNTARRYVVDTLAINPLRRMPGKPGRRAEAPIHVWDLRPVPPAPDTASSPGVTLPVYTALWPHPAPVAARDIPLITDLMRSLQPRRWRFDIEQLPSHIGDVFGNPAAEGFQIDMWLHPMHLPPDHLHESAAEAPGVARVMLLDVPAPDRIPEPGGNGTETISGVAEPFPDRPSGRALVDLNAMDVTAHQGLISICQHRPPPAGLYGSWTELAEARGAS